MKVLVKMISGSHLYGTNTENSDTDYKGIYLPEMEDCILGKVKQTINQSTGNNGTKNTKDDIDNEYYSIQHFIKLATTGETIAIDMLHTPDKFILEQTDVWKHIRDNRSMFYSKNMKAFVGYARNQAKRYSVKGERLQLVEDILKYLQQLNEMDKLGNHFIKLISIGATLTGRDEFGNKFIDVNGRMFSETITVKYAKQKIQNLIDNYGHRARKAKEAFGVDWKAISHAIRVVLEIREILTTNDLIFPLADAMYITDIKLGKYKVEDVLEYLDSNIHQVEILTSKSNLPEKVDTEYWDNFIVNLYK